MPSTFSWMDLRDDDAQRVREALSAFDDRGMIDPLGFGQVRDAFSEMLFPGTSTLHTRARYFVLIPWVYQRLDEGSTQPKNAPWRARDLEISLIEALLRGSPTQEGIIGRQARGATQQLASGAYWGPLQRWGIRRYNGSRQQYLASLDSRRRLRRSRAADADSLDRDLATEWHPALPSRPDGLWDEATIELQPDEALFLQERVLESAPQSYLAHLLLAGGPSDAEAPWHDPARATAPAAVATRLHHAELFSLLALGGELRYNRDLSDAIVADGGEPMDRDFPGRLAEWVDAMSDYQHTLAAWDRDELWHLVTTQNPRLGMRIRRFVDQWLDLAVADPEAAAEGATAGRILIKREASMKGARAKLANRRARERDPAPQGGGRMTFRWAQVRGVAGEIARGVQDAQPA